MLLNLLIHAMELLETPGKKHNCALNHWKVYWNASVNSGVHTSLLATGYQLYKLAGYRRARATTATAPAVRRPLPTGEQQCAVMR